MALVFTLALMLFFLLLVALFAGAETGFVALDIHYLKHRSQEEAAFRERSLLKIARQPERFLALTLVGINMSIVVVSALNTSLLEDYDPIVGSLGTALLSAIIFFACEVVPKMAFSARPLEMLVRVIGVVELADKILGIPIFLITSVTRWAMGLTGLRSDERKKRQISRNELLILLGLGASSGAISDRPHRMARGIIGLKETHICEIMIPRVKMVALDVGLSLDKARKVFIESGYSRIPVFEGVIDQIVGIVYFKDVFLKSGETPGAPESGKTLRELLKPAVFVPEPKNAYQLFRDMMTKKFQTAVVLDEYGATAGLVSLEDLIEEVVGEIHDELDESPLGLKYHDDGSVSVRAEINLSTLEDEGGILFSVHEGMTTLNGLIIARLGRIPGLGESFAIDGHRFEIVMADQKKVVTVRIHPVPHPTGAN